MRVLHEIVWTDAEGREHQSRYLTSRGGSAPRTIVAADDRLTADAAFRLVSQGTGLVWGSDYHNARQLLQALGRRIDKRRKPPAPDAPPNVRFNAWRQEQAQRAGMFGLLLVPIADGKVLLPRGPDVRASLGEAFGELPGEFVLPLRDLLAAISAHEWRKNGVPIAALAGAKIHPHYGVFPPTRQDYIDLIAKAPLPDTSLAFDLGTGSGILAAVLLHRGVQHVVATDNAPRALASAREAFIQLGVGDRVELVADRLYPDGKAPLIVCNPPWLPARASTSLESAVYDTDGAMLRDFLAGLAAHLSPGGEGWLVLSDLAEHLGLRTRQSLLDHIAAAGLIVLGRSDAAPSTKGARDHADPLYFARSREVVSLWRLGPSP